MNTIFALAGVVVLELYRRKDFYVLFILTALVTLLLGSISFFDDDKVVRYLKEICLLLIWISTLVISITTAGRQIPAERESRTIFPLLAKPVSRAQLIIGKFLGCWLATGMVLFVFYLFFGVISGTHEHFWPVLAYAKALWLHWICLAVIVALSLLGSVLFTSQSANSTICFIVVIGILLVGGHLNAAALQMSEPSRSIIYTLYYAIPHLEWYDVRDLLTHNHDIISWLDVLGATAYGLAYTGLLTGATWVVFTKKRLV